MVPVPGQVVSVFRAIGRWCGLGSIEVWEDSPSGARAVLKSSLLHLHKGLTVQHPATFVRRNVYNRVGLFNTGYRIGADYDFILRCLEADISWIIMNDVFTRMRAGGKGGSTFTLEDGKIRISHKLSSTVGEAIVGANSLTRHLTRQVILKIFGKKILSTLRGYLWRNRTYRR